MTQPRHSHATPTSFGLAEERLDDGEVVVIAVRGELDLFTAPELREALREHTDAVQRPPHVIADLSGCSFVDASGCQVLLRAARRLAAHERRLAIVNTNPGTARILSVMGLDELFPVVATRAEAAAAVRRPAT
ncbi:STAS domain-containing protein [Conexibacter arvalis]|uniref:Anti-sigma factor antagonist n=1 Tax=Conexibacter arvalis TaxID=912552 RepID=A0A840IJM9_9ACTN|nr:STAS domain-containing protein [Conexibacter arvalis]MBB4665232.1 anti-sigma B factor antagonist [Conexibacter arvalis]